MSEANQNERVVKPDFPICQTGKRIPWSIAERAYEGYVKRYGRCQTLERIAERGGFYVEEMDQLYPTWREEVEEVYLLRKEVQQLREDAERWRAIVGCKRVRVLGTAGVLPEHRKEDGYAHIGLELWTRHSHDSEPRAVEMLTTFADIARPV